MPVDIRINYCEFDCVGRPFGIDGVLKAMQKYGIEKAVLLPSMAMDCDFRLGNKILFDAVKSDDRLFAYLSVNPNYPDESIRLMRSAMASPKFVGIALFQGASRPYPNIDDYREILSAYRRFLKPVFVNVQNGDAVVAAVEMAREFPGLKFILGMMGGDNWKRAITYHRQLNLLLETSGSFDAEKVEEAVEHFGAHRVLFGSDLPYSDIGSALALVQSSGLPKDAVDQILTRNAQKLFSPTRLAENE
jgi:predicted TIM-barrel fold metal-dependent hydrolase